LIQDNVPRILMNFDKTRSSVNSQPNSKPAEFTDTLPKKSKTLLAIVTNKNRAQPSVLTHFSWVGLSMSPT